MGRGQRGAPPKWARSLLDAVLPIGAVAESITGDLEAEYLDIRGPNSLARLWYSVEALKLAFHYRNGLGTSELVQDVRYGLRMLRRMPMVTLVAVLSLAAGVAASTMMFATMYGFLYAPLPYTDQDELQILMQVDRATGSEQLLSAGALADLTELTPALDDFAAWRSFTTTLSGGDEPVQVLRVDATPNVFRVLGRTASIGRTFSDDEGRPGTDRVLVLTDNLWKSSFAADPRVVGRQVQVAGRPHTVVGVLPSDFEFVTGNVGLVVANTFELERDIREGGSLIAVATLPDGISPDQVQLQASRAWQQISSEHPDELSRFDFRLLNLREQFPGDGDRRLVQVSWLVAVFVLLIAAANVANLLLARAEERAREIAVRLSLGASRMRLIRQLLTESTLLAGLGGILGVVMAVFALDQLAALWPVVVPKAFQPKLDGSVLAFSAIASMGVGVFFGLAPALQALQANQDQTLSGSARGGTAGRASKRIRSAFVVGEIAVAMALLSGAAAMASMASSIVNVDMGLRSESMLTFRTTASGARYDDPGELARFHREIEQGLLNLPQAAAVAVMDELPRGRNVRRTNFEVDGRETPSGQERPETLLLTTNHDYFEAMDIPLTAGRYFTSSDRLGDVPVVIVSRRFTELHFPGASALGARVLIDDEYRQIVGVVENVFHSRVELPGGLAGMAYLPMEQHPIRTVAYAVRTNAEPTGLAADLRPTVWAVDPNASVNAVRTLDDFVAQEMAVMRVMGGIMALFGLLALALSALGVYGVMAHGVAQRNREIGVRRALGAQSWTVVRLVLRGGLAQAGIGIALGLPLAVLIYRAALGISVQFRADLGGPERIAMVALLLGAVCVAASYLPARRAAGVDPIRSLRADG